MTGKRVSGRPVLLPELVTVRLSESEKQRLLDRATEAGETESEHGRKLLRAGMGEVLSDRTKERLQVLSEVVQRNALLRAVRGEVLTEEAMTDLERECARKVDDILQRRLALIEAL